MTMRSLTGVDFTGTIRKTDADHVAAQRYARYSSKPTMVRRPVEKPEPAPPEGWRARLTPLRMFLIFGCLATLMTVWVWETTAVRSGMIEIEKLKNERTEIQKRNEAIQVEVAKLSSYERIERIAGEKLGMRASKEKPEMIVLDPDLASAVESENYKP